MGSLFGEGHAGKVVAHRPDGAWVVLLRCLPGCSRDARRRSAPLQVAVRLQLPQGEGDSVAALGEAIGQATDTDRGALR